MKKIISIVTIIIGGLLVIGGVAPMIMGAVLKAQIAESVGVIGGADGPTAIFVTGVPGTGQVIGKIAVGLLVMAAGILGCRKKK